MGRFRGDVRGSAFALAFVAACGGSVDRAETRPGVVTGQGGQAAASGGTGPDSGASTGGTSGGSGGGGVGEAGRYIDPGCPAEPRVPGVTECDPFADDTGCALGERCLPTVEYAADCGTEIFGTLCTTAGSGVQGDDCVDEPCSERHVCVTTGQGSQCVRLCRLTPEGDDCPPGLLCQALDVDGYEICF